MISIHDVKCFNGKIKRPIAAAISMTPVKYIIPTLSGITSGSIAAIPFEKAKWPKAVNINMKDIAILPDKEKAGSSLNNFVTSKEMPNAIKRTNNGFILIIIHFVTQKPSSEIHILTITFCMRLGFNKPYCLFLFNNPIPSVNKPIVRETAPT
jgi:hypothetical protein